MSFVAGFVTGMRTGEVVERRKEQGHLREYMQRRGLTIIDQNGLPVPLDSVVDAVRVKEKRSGRTMIVVGVTLLAVGVVAGGSTWAALALLT